LEYTAQDMTWTYGRSLLSLCSFIVNERGFSVYVYYERRVSRAVWLFFVRMYGKIGFHGTKISKEDIVLLLSLDLAFSKENAGYQEEG
jgi:hypothetical protein